MLTLDADKSTTLQLKHAARQVSEELGKWGGMHHLKLILGVGYIHVS